MYSHSVGTSTHRTVSLGTVHRPMPAQQARPCLHRLYHQWGPSKSAFLKLVGSTAMLWVIHLGMTPLSTAPLD